MFCMVWDGPDVGGCDVGGAVSLGELPHWASYQFRVLHCLRDCVMTVRIWTTVLRGGDLHTCIGSLHVTLGPVGHCIVWVYSLGRLVTCIACLHSHGRLVICIACLHSRDRLVIHITWSCSLIGRSLGLKFSSCFTAYSDIYHACHTHCARTHALTKLRSKLMRVCYAAGSTRVYQQRWVGVCSAVAGGAEVCTVFIFTHCVFTFQYCI